MDPNYANLWNQMYSLSQHPNSSTSGMSLLEQAAIQTGLTPSFPMGHGMSGNQMLSDPSLMRSSQASISSPQPTPNLAATASTAASRLPSFANIKERGSHLESEGLLRDSPGVASLALGGHSDMAKWSTLFQDYGVRASDPPPAHTGPSRPSSQVKSRTENDQLMDILIRRQMEPSNPPVAHQAQVPQKYHSDTYSSSSKYQEPVPKFSTPPIHKYQEPPAIKYPVVDPVTHHQKYQVELTPDTIPGYSQKTPSTTTPTPPANTTQIYRNPDMSKILQQPQPHHAQPPQSDYGNAHKLSQKYSEESANIQGRPGANSSNSSQLQRMMSSSEPSPQSHDSSPHMGLSSPQLSHHNSPQMTSTGNLLSHDKVYTPGAPYGSSLASQNRQQYIVSSAPPSSVYSMNQQPPQNVSSAATLHYEAVSPATQHTSEHISYNTLNLDGLTNDNTQVKDSHHHHPHSGGSMLSMKIPSPPVHSNSPMPVASPTSTVQHIPAGPIRAQADSTTKSKRGGGRRGGGRGGNRGGGRSKKSSKKDEECMQQMDSGSMQMQQQQQQQADVQQQLSKHPPIMQMTSSQQAIVTMPQPGGMGGMLQSGNGTMMMSDTMHNMPPQGGYSSLVDSYGVQQYSDEAMLHVNVAQGMLGMMASPDLKSEQENILMNMHDNRGHYMGGPGGDQQEVVTQASMMAATSHSGADIMSHNNTVEDNMGLGLTSVDPKRPKLKTKAELKFHQPQEKVQEVDEEFEHLATNRVKSSGGSSGGGGTADIKPKLPITDSSFQSSFLSFLQGNKQETLSSVTNSCITNKPELPKYIPEPPRPKPIRTPVLEKLSSDSKSLSTDMKIKPVTFSDDDDSSRGSSSVKINKTVEGVISELGEDNKSEKQVKQYKSFLQTSPGTSKQDERSPLRLKIKVSGIKVPSSNQKPPKRYKSTESENHKKSKSKHGRRESTEEYYAEVVHVDDESPERSPSPVVRPRSSRKAKEKVEQKRKARMEKRSKKKKKKSAVAGFSDYSSAEDFFESDEEKEYDSDKDPVWIPGEKPQDLFSQELDPELRKKQMSLTKSKLPRLSGPRRRRKDSEENYEDDLTSSKRPKSTGSNQNTGRGVGGSKSGAGEGTTSGTSTTVAGGVIKSKAVVMEECDSDDNSPHQYSKGNFVMEKKELCHPETFIIWKIDAGKLIQKYEPFMLDGKLVHKSLSTYSSWSDYFRPNYIGIQVRTISQLKNQEVVEVLEAYHPNKENDKLESEEHMASFNVFVQILVSHSLEPGFLSLVKQHDDDYYTVPLQKMEKILAEKKIEIGDVIKWNPQFKEALEKYPLLRISEYSSGQNSSVHCQASSKCASEAPVRTVRLYGEPYHFESLDKSQTGHLTMDKALEFQVGKTATKCLRQYHRLHHFKYRVYKKCLYMVECCKRAPGKDTSELLDQCLQNRVWVQNLFREFKQILGLPDHHPVKPHQAKESTTTSSSTSTTAKLTSPPQSPAVTESTEPSLPPPPPSSVPDPPSLPTIPHQQEAPAHEYSAVNASNPFITQQQQPLTDNYTAALDSNASLLNSFLNGSPPR